MTEKDIERTEKKVDLFFKILLSLKFKHIHLFHRKFMDGFINELIPVYNLYAEKEVISNFPTQEKIQNWENKLNYELDRSKQDYLNGNFLANEQDIIKMRIKDLGIKLESLSKLSENKEVFDEKSVELHRIGLFMDLQKKLGITEEYDSFGYRKLVKEKDNLKKDIEVLIKELHIFLDNDEKED